MVGVQIAARAEGTLRPLLVQADLLAGNTRIATRSLEVFPSTTLQLRRLAFDRQAPPGLVVVRLQAREGQPGGVVYGATQQDRQPGGALRLDGRVEFADQDLALRVLHRRSLWTARGSPRRGSACRPRGGGVHPGGRRGWPWPDRRGNGARVAPGPSRHAPEPAMTTQQPRLAALLLAAGASTRMGKPKALLPWGGVPLVRHQVDLLAAQPAVDQLIVVVGALLDEVRTAA